MSNNELFLVVQKLTNICNRLSNMISTFEQHGGNIHLSNNNESEVASLNSEPQLGGKHSDSSDTFNLDGNSDSLSISMTSTSKSSGSSIDRYYLLGGAGEDEKKDQKTNPAPEDEKKAPADEKKDPVDDEEKKLPLANASFNQLSDSVGESEFLSHLTTISDSEM